MAYVEAPQFGVEIELLVRPKPALLEFMCQYGYEESIEYFQARKNRRALHRALAETLSEGGLAAKVDEDEGEFSTWLVAYDGSIRESDGFCRFPPCYQLNRGKLLQALSNPFLLPELTSFLRLSRGYIETSRFSR